jgi:hypothetical protein
MDIDSFSSFYDSHAPALYGQILRDVKDKALAEKVLQKVLVCYFNNRHLVKDGHNKPLISLLNTSRKNATRTLKAIKMFEESRGSFEQL